MSTNAERLALHGAALGFAALGVAVALAGDGPAFAIWRAAAASALFGVQALPDPVLPLAAITDGILGATIAGKWIAAWWLVRIPLARGEAWAKHALVWGLVSWAVLDSAMSVLHGAVFNVWMINAVPVVIFGGLLWRRRVSPSAPPLAAARPWRVLEISCWISASTGVLIATTIDTPVFAPWRAGAAAALGADTGELAAPLRTWLAFVAGPIGATTLGHFVMLALAVRHAPHERWVLAAVATSVLAWFAIDSALSLVRDAAFNLLLVNLPALALVGVPWVWAARSRQGGPHPSG